MTRVKVPPSLLIIAHGIDGGIAPLASTLAYGMQEQGWCCTVRYVGRPAPSKFVPADQLREIDSQAITTGKARSLVEMWGLIRSILPVWRVVQKSRPTAIIFAGFIPALLYPPILRLFTSAQFIMWDHAPQNTFLKIKRLAFPLALKCMDRIVCISHSTASAMTEYFGIPPDEITIIPNSVDPTRWQALPPAPDFSTLRIIMPARLDLNQKDQITLIKAAAKLHRQGVALEVTMVGSGIDEGRVREAIEAEEASDYVRLVAHSDDVPSLVAHHNVLCLSSKFEGLGLVLVEAMLARRVAIASRVSGCVDVIIDGINGFLFSAGSVDDCARVLRALRYEPEIPQIIEVAYHGAVVHYAPHAMIEGFKRVLLE